MLRRDSHYYYSFLLQYSFAQCHVFNIALVQLCIGKDDGQTDARRPLTPRNDKGSTRDPKKIIRKWDFFLEMITAQYKTL